MSDANPGLMTIFGEALEQPDPSTRAAYLERADTLKRPGSKG